MKESFILYTEQKVVIDKLTDEQAGQLIKAIYEYAETEEAPKLDMLIDLVFTPIKQSIDRNSEKWEETKQKRSEAGKKGMATRWKQDNNDNNVITNDNKNNNVNQSITSITVNDNVNVNVNDNVNVNNNIYTPSEDKTSTGGTAKASKHKYGKYKNVLLKDEELQALKEKYSNWKELIEYLDEYIERLGYKAKSHYLCMGKWVVDAVEKDKKKTRKAENVSNYTSRQYNNLDKFYDNLGGV